MDEESIFKKWLKCVGKIYVNDMVTF